MVADSGNQVGGKHTQVDGQALDVVVRLGIHRHCKVDGRHDDEEDDILILELLSQDIDELVDVRQGDAVLAKDALSPCDIADVTVDSSLLVRDEELQQSIGVSKFLEDIE